MTKVLKVGRENGQKVNFSLRLSYLTLKLCSTNFTLHWLLPKTRKNLPLGFLISFRIIKDFH